MSENTTTENTIDATEAFKAEAAEPETNDQPEESPELTEEEKAENQKMLDYANLQGIAQHFEATKLALSLKANTTPESVERIALFDRIINNGGPLVTPGVCPWKINNEEEK